MIFLRRIYLIFAAPLLPLFFFIGSFFNAKLRLGFAVRQKKNGRASWLVGTAESKPFWFHCASGEFEYAKPVIRLLKKHHPEIPILVTYFSTSVQKAVENFAGVDFAAPTPWENAKNWRDFLEFYAPRILLIARTDTWPEMLYQTAQKKIPSLLFSATLVSDSGRLKFPAKIFTKMSLQDLTQIYCVSEDDAVLFADLGFSAKTRVAGDTRYDQVLTRIDSAQAKTETIRKKILNDSDSRRILVAGSTWSEDEIQLLIAARELKDKINFILVPHEPTENHLNRLKKRLTELGISFSLYSENKQATKDLLIIDQVGVLAELYLLADFAFVGGSFRRTVHSVMEPLAAGCVTFVGPLHLNNREAIEFQNLPDFTHEPVQAVRDGAELAKKLGDLLKLDANRFLKLKSQVMEQVHKRAGRSELVVKWVQGIV